MPVAARVHKGFFTKVKVARELLRQQAEEILKQYMDVVKAAQDAGDYETAAKSLQWLIEHMPADEEGQRLVETSVDKQKQVEAPKAPPAVQIGIVVGGSTGQQKALPKPKDKPTVEVVDADSKPV